MSLAAFVLALTSLLSALRPSEARADDPPRTDQPQKPWYQLDVGGPPVRFESLIGLSLTSSTDYLGSNHRGLSIRPLGAIRFGRLRLSTSGGGSLLGFGTVSDEAGASLDLIRSSRLKVRTGLRLTSGRSASDSDDLAGMPDVRRTALGRVSLGFDLTARWRLVQPWPRFESILDLLELEPL